MAEVQGDGGEADHVVAATAERPPVVVAAAASTIEVERCRDAAPEVLAERFARAAYRPLFSQVDDVVPDAAAPLDDVRRQTLRAVGVTVGTA